MCRYFWQSYMGQKCWTTNTLERVNRVFYFFIFLKNFDFFEKFSFFSKNMHLCLLFSAYQLAPLIEDNSILKKCIKVDNVSIGMFMGEDETCYPRVGGGGWGGCAMLPKMQKTLLNFGKIDIFLNFFFLHNRNFFKIYLGNCLMNLQVHLLKKLLKKVLNLTGDSFNLFVG